MSLEKALEDFAREHSGHLGLVSLNAPLISNLSVLNNITLIKEFHHHMSRRRADALVLSCLERMNLAHIAPKRNPALTNAERFCAMVLRATMVEENAVLIDRPFKIIPELQDSNFIGEVLKTFDDLLHECCVFDYIWNRDRYGEGWGWS